MPPIRGPAATGLLLHNFVRTNPARGQVRMAPVTKTLAGGALAGVLTGAVALGVAELVAAVTGPRGAPVIAVGQTAIDLTPIPVKEFAIAHFGSRDKEILITGILVLLAAFAALIGVLAARRISRGLAGLAAFGGLGVAAAVSRPAATAVDVLPTLAGVAVAAVALVVLVRAVRTTTAWAGAGVRADRRGFLIAAAGAGE